MRSLFLPLLLIVANVMGAGMIVPQVIRLRRHRIIDGVSEAWVGVGLALNLWWVTYAIEERLWGILPVSIVGFSLYALIGRQIIDIVGPSARRSMAIGAIAPGLLPLLFLLFGGWTAAGLAIGVSYGLQFAPAAFSALRSEEVGGISPVTWGMAGIEAAIWVVYGLVIGDPALIVGGGGGLAMATAIMVTLATRQTASSSSPRAKRAAITARTTQ